MLNRKWAKFCKFFTTKFKASAMRRERKGKEKYRRLEWRMMRADLIRDEGWRLMIGAWDKAELNRQVDLLMKHNSLKRVHKEEDETVWDKTWEFTTCTSAQFLSTQRI